MHELNIWYHTLNCGYRTRISGETDFPCITDERVGAGRSYVQIDGALSYDAGARGCAAAGAYVSDGYSHLMDLTANGVRAGRRRRASSRSPRRSRVTLDRARGVPAAGARAPERGARIAARVPYWTPEHARIGGAAARSTSRRS